MIKPFVLAFLPGVGPLELIVIFVVALLIFGPQKLPEVGKALGESIKQFKKASKALDNDSESSDNNN
ncbi:MAG: twin-arginine translocase TatA/TatE family subunit [Cyanobacteriota bacterium]